MVSDSRSDGKGRWFDPSSAHEGNLLLGRGFLASTALISVSAQRGRDHTTTPTGATSGDFDAWLAYWEPEQDDDFLFDRSVMYSNERMEVTAPCEITSESSDPMVVTCSVFVEDDFHGAGGLTSDATIEFHINGGGLIVSTNSTTYQDENGNCCPQWQAFNAAFHRWLSDTHPDVYE